MLASCTTFHGGVCSVLPFAVARVTCACHDASLECEKLIWCRDNTIWWGFSASKMRSLQETGPLFEFAPCLWLFITPCAVCKLSLCRSADHNHTVIPFVRISLRVAHVTLCSLRGVFLHLLLRKRGLLSNELAQWNAPAVLGLSRTPHPAKYEKSNHITVK